MWFYAELFIACLLFAYFWWMDKCHTWHPIEEDPQQHFMMMLAVALLCLFWPISLVVMVAGGVWDWI